MPLSDHEQKLLEQMERALYAEDPKFATQMKGSASRGTARRRALIGFVIAVLGLAVIIFGVTTQLVIVGALGFATMVAGVAWALTPPRPPTRVGGAGSPNVTGPVPIDAGSRPGAARPARPARPGKRREAKGTSPRKSRPSGTFFQRMEERWERRRRTGEW
ncbi:MAG TPA: DUF3040 domain-containing protein [Dermatophilaceae bacterium]|nr:DUF3040 domain-containing protein [Dermatophilaceae bacterium]